MVAIAEDVVVKLTAEISGFNKGMEKSSAALGRFEANFNRSMANVRRGLAAVGAGLVVRQYVQLADASTNLAARISLVAGSGENAVRVQKQLLDIANRTRVGFEGVVTLYTRLGRSADELGVSQERLLRFTETLSQAMKISGATNAEASATVIQLSQALASGQLRGAELNSVLEQGGRVATALAEGLGVPIGALKKLGEEGKLTAQTVIGAIESQSETIQREFDRMPSTVSDALTVTQNKLLNFVDKMDDSSKASRELVDGINKLGGALDDPDFAAGMAKALTHIVWLLKEAAEKAAWFHKNVVMFGENNLGESFGVFNPNAPVPADEMLRGFQRDFLSSRPAPAGRRTGHSLSGFGDSGAERMREAERAALQYADAMSELDFKLEQLVRTEQEAAYQEQLRNALSSAGVTLATAEGQAIAEKVAKLQELTAAGEAQAAAWEVEAANVNRVLEEMHQKMAETAEEWRQIGEQMKSGLADVLVDIAMGTEDARQAMARFVEEIGRAIAKMLLLKGIEAGVDAIFGSVGGKALGGLVNPGNAYLVGESGPELIVPRVPSSVVPNNRLGGGGAMITYAPVINAGSGASRADIAMAMARDRAEFARVVPKLVEDAIARGKLRFR